VVGDDPADRSPELLFVTILRHRRYWQVMWISHGKNFKDFHAASMTAAVAAVSETAAEFHCADPAGAAAEFLIWIFGRRLPVSKGPQLLVTGDPGQFTATDACDGSVFAGATLEDLLAAAGANPARAGDYAMSWLRPVSALRPARD
jgi:hypothetical protein